MYYYLEVKLEVRNLVHGHYTKIANLSQYLNQIRQTEARLGVCLLKHNNLKNQRVATMKFYVWPLYQNCRFSSNCEPKPSKCVWFVNMISLKRIALAEGMWYNGSLQQNCRLQQISNLMSNGKGASPK